MVGEAELELRIAPQTVIDLARRVRLIDRFDEGRRISPGGGAIEAVNGDFLIPDEKVKAITLRPATASGPPVASRPINGCGVDVEGDIVDEVVKIDKDGVIRIAGAVEVQPLDLP